MTVEYHDGLLAIDLAGEPYQLGWQHGRLLRHEIWALWDACERLILRARGRWVGWVASQVLHGAARLMHLYIPPALRRELQGVAAGSGLPYHHLLLLNCFDDVMNNFRVVDRLAARLACTAFAAGGARAADGTAIAGRNLDYYFRAEFMAAGAEPTRVLQRHVVVFRVRPRHGLPFVAVGWPGIIGAVTAQNAAGLALACLTSPAWSERPWGTPLPLVYRGIAQFAPGLAHAVERLRAARRTIGNNLVLASATERAVCTVELSARAVDASPPVGEVVVTSNHYLSPRLAREQDALINPTSPLRLARARALLAEGPLDVARAQAILLDEECLDPAAPQWARLYNAGTIYSTVFEPGAGRIWVRAADTPDRRFVPFAVPDARPRASVPGGAPAEHPAAGH
ncbi:MAG TPA: C45 family peptidase [Chloroflexota bacterium]|nr:C45 family peptidase [Chloroflexota bacterium]